MSAFGQSFECAPLGPLPGDPAANCEGVCSDGQVAATGIVAIPSCGFPSLGGGLQYLDVRANGGIAQPVGGPVAHPLPTIVSEVRIPIPVGATLLSFDWEFFNAEGQNSTFNDGMSVDIVTPAGTLVANLVYADASSLVQVGGCVAGGTEIAPAGPQGFVGGLPLYGPCDYISIAVWNGGDNAVQSRAYFDHFVFDTFLLGCLPPCFAGTPTLSYSSPGGAGCLLVSMTGLSPNGIYFLAVTLYAGAFPNGWLYGLDIPLIELNALITTGFPFFGPLGVCGSASLGPFCGLPSGLPLYGLAFGIPAGSPTPAIHSNAASYVIP